ncbi:hypothetical protein ONZ45_g4938 [Pleurotus djamor]|nr:hypothetical protein ONZ45_g4938 [Pleurotus djamor]
MLLRTHSFSNELQRGSVVPLGLRYGRFADLRVHARISAYLSVIALFGTRSSFTSLVHFPIPRTINPDFTYQST